jgi:hypothetical protein
MNKAKVIFSQIVLSYQDALEVLQPHPQAFNLPAPAIPAQFVPILSSWFLAVTFMWCNHLNDLLLQRLIQAVAVISFGTNQTLRFICDHHLLQSWLDKGDFMRRSTFKVDGERKTMADWNTGSYWYW